MKILVKKRAVSNRGFIIPDRRAAASPESYPGAVIMDFVFLVVLAPGMTG